MHGTAARRLHPEAVLRGRAAWADASAADDGCPRRRGGYPRGARARAGRRDRRVRRRATCDDAAGARGRRQGPVRGARDRRRGGTVGDRPAGTACGVRRWRADGGGDGRCRRQAVRGAVRCRGAPAHGRRRQRDSGARAGAAARHVAGGPAGAVEAAPRPAGACNRDDRPVGRHRRAGERRRADWPRRDRRRVSDACRHRSAAADTPAADSCR
mmetsp:Transcript_49374/g.152409  ORF Transcript_49374/g.152409 Transcript_49374/m.152409 type:complete len:213 (+) Transcript_49374:530-1168(+)